MIRRLLPGFVALAGVLLGSCYPVDESPPPRSRPRANANPPPVAHNEPALTEPRQEQPAPTAAAQPAAAPIRKSPPPTTAREAPPEVPGRNLPVAQKAPGRDGFVLSPYTSKLIFVRGIPGGTVVPDQTSPASPQKFFVVP